MRLLKLLPIIFFFTIVALSQKSAEKGEIAVDFHDLKVTILNTNPREFKTAISNHLARIEALLYEGIDGKEILIEAKGSKNLAARIRFEIGILQYYNDDVRAAPLNFKYESRWTPIKILNNSIHLPQFYDNYPNVPSIYEHLGYANSDAFETFLESKYFQTIKRESYFSQKRFYTSVLGDRRRRYEACCPEYTEDAKIFLARKPSEFSKLHDLAVEIYFPKLILEIQGLDRNGKIFTYSLLGEKE